MPELAGFAIPSGTDVRLLNIVGGKQPDVPFGDANCGLGSSDCGVTRLDWSQLVQAMRRIWIIASGCALLVTVAAVPWSRVLISQWTVRVIDQDSRPVAKVRISEIWNNYSLDRSGGGDLFTDDSGTVVFPSEQLRAPLAYWFLKPLTTRLEYGVHASSGTFGYVGVSDIRFAPPPSDACQNQRECAGAPLVAVLQIGRRSD